MLNILKMVLNKKAQRLDIEGMIKAGIILLIVGAIFGGILIPKNIANTFSGLGEFLLIIAIIMGVISLFFPFIRGR